MTVKITEIEETNETKLLRVEGKLTNIDAAMLEKKLEQIEDERMALDLSGVTFIDSEAASVVRNFEQRGGELIGADFFIRAVIDAQDDGNKSPQNDEDRSEYKLI